MTNYLNQNVTIKTYAGGLIFTGTVVEQEDNWIKIFVDGTKDDVLKFFVDLDEVTVRPDFERETYQELKVAQEGLKKLTKYLDIEDGDEGYEVAVKVFESDEDGKQTYDVEINVYQDGEYIDGWVTDIYTVGARQPETLKAAKRRAQAVRRSVRNWVSTTDALTLKDGIEIYNV